MAFTTLVDTATLATHLADPGFAVVDCRFALNDDGWGEREYAARHIPGAVFAHLGHDLAGSPTGQNGRHPLPDPAALAATFGRLGIGDGKQVVAYDQDSGMYAGRLWWLLRWLGHDAVAVLNGGFARWLAEGRGTTSGYQHRRTSEFHGAPRDGMMVSADQVSALIGTSDWRLVDARAPERYRGDVEPIDRVAGHIPGAVNHPFKSSLTETGAFRSADELREALGSSLGGFPPDRIVCYCGSGVTACHNLLALEHAGLRGAKLYPGSWSEWSSDPSRPIERGDAQ
jgi:thiosulfate/3-mercaptopyruvate sulfurtransferase